MPTSHPASKAALRSDRLRARAALAPVLRDAHNASICHHLLQAAWFTEAVYIGLYVAFKGEVDLANFAGAARSDNRQLYLPVIDQPTCGHLRFGQWAEKTTLVPNRWGIPEPPQPWVGVEALDLLLIPLVAFDGRGNRIGMGGGYYDRTLATLSPTDQAGKARPKLVGVAYRVQEIDNFAPDPWDQALDAIVTEDGLWIPPNGLAD